MRGYLFSNLSLWSYAEERRAWEPLIEPWQLLAHADVNQAGVQRAGVEPGAWLRLTSTQSNVAATLTHTAVASLLLAANEWSAALANGAGGGGRSAPGATPAHTVVVQLDNQLGLDVEVAVDDGKPTQARAAVGLSVCLLACPWTHALLDLVPRPRVCVHVL
jgi:hypothetical protein